MVSYLYGEYMYGVILDGDYMYGVIFVLRLYVWCHICVDIICMVLFWMDIICMV